MLLPASPHPPNFVSNFNFFKQSTEFNVCSPYIHSCGVIHQSEVYLWGFILLKKTKFLTKKLSMVKSGGFWTSKLIPSPKKLSVVKSGCFWASFPFQARVWAGLVLYWSCDGCCGFMSTVHVQKLLFCKVLPGLWLLQSLYTSSAVSLSRVGQGWRRCPICDWAFYDHLFSAFWQLWVSVQRPSLMQSRIYAALWVER